MQMKKVSVIIPFFSHKEWLKEALDSVFSQTYQNFEVILVNDGSKEDINDIISNYDSRLIYLTQKNAGPGAARNKGIRQASGDYIAFEDSDDIWLPTKLEEQIAFMEEIGAIWCHTGFYNWWPETNTLKVANTSRDYDNIYLQRFVTTRIATPSIVIKRNIFNEVSYLFPEYIRNGEDGALYTKLAKKYSLALVEEPLVKVRMRGNNSKTHAIERFKLEADTYKSLKNSRDKFPRTILLTKRLYSIYDKIFSGRKGKMADFLAKCCWVIPYIIERIYIRQLTANIRKDERYIKRME